MHDITIVIQTYFLYLSTFKNIKQNSQTHYYFQNKILSVIAVHCNYFLSVLGEEQRLVYLSPKPILIKNITPLRLEKLWLS